MSIYIDKIGQFEEKYSMFYRPEEFHFLGMVTHGLLKFNCIETEGIIIPMQIEAYNHYKHNEQALDQALQQALSAYKQKQGIGVDEIARVTSVEFAKDMNYLLLDTSWDAEQGIAALFDNQCRMRILEQDDLL